MREPLSVAKEDFKDQLGKSNMWLSIRSCFKQTSIKRYFEMKNCYKLWSKNIQPDSADAHL